MARPTPFPFLSFPFFFFIFYMLFHSAGRRSRLASSVSQRSRAPRPLGLCWPFAPCPRHRAAFHGDSINPPSPHSLCSAASPRFLHPPWLATRCALRLRPNSTTSTIDCAQTVFSWLDQSRLPNNAPTISLQNPSPALGFDRAGNNTYVSGAIRV